MITYKTFLMEGTGTESLTFTKLIDIRDFPDLFAAPEMLEKTTLSDGGKRYEPGIKENEALTFTANYDFTKFKELKAKEDTVLHLSVWFGGTESKGVVTPTGSDGKFDFDGKIAVTISGGGVNEIVEMVITIALDSDIAVSE